MNKIVLIGLGYVGKAYAYSIINQNITCELILIDTNDETLIGNYSDLKDAASLSNVNLKIGKYEDCENAQIVVICAGSNQKPNETRLDLLHKNNVIIKSITEKVTKTKFNGIFLVATNPVDVCTYLVYKYSAFKKEKIIGSGTMLDTIRLKNILAEKYNVDYSNINAFVLGEHGDSSVPIWSSVTIKGNFIDNFLSEDEKELIGKKVHNVAYDIIEKKGETSYGIGRVLSYLSDIILNDKNEEVIVSSIDEDASISSFYILNKNGLVEKKEVFLNKKEKEKLIESKQIIKNAILSLEE